MTKTIVITGATDGIGLLTAKMLAAQDHRLVLHGRNEAKLDAAAAEIGGAVLTCKADLSSLTQTAALAEEIQAKVEHVDVLINNAGVFKVGDPILPDGQDMRFVVNTFAPYLLTTALLPMIPADGRIINLSSAAQAPVSIAAMQGHERLGDMDAYAQSKRAITLWSQDMARTHLDGPVVIAVNPGSLLASKMVQEGFGVAGKDLSIGADILCRLALEDRFAGDSGKYWDNDAGQFAPIDPSQADAVTTAIRELI
ncbi:MAG: SDR family NAD(P)-dependent oxidoreductase [Pseudomonadota bacterium]